MSKVIQFLETMGGNAAAARMSTAEYLAAVAALEADEPSRRALAARDGAMLVEALDARRFMVCAVVAPDEGNEPADSPAEDAPQAPDESPMQAS